MYKLIIFDFFDVIHSDPFKRWLKQYGYRREGGFEESSRLVDLGEISEQEFYKRLAELSGQTLQSVQEIFGEIDLIDESMVSLIEELKSNYKIAVLSNSTGEYLRPILEFHKIAHLFDEVIISAEIRMAKPDLEIFEFLINKMDVTKEDAIFVDDDLNNTSAAKSYGIDSILFKDAEKLRQDLKLADILK